MFANLDEFECLTPLITTSSPATQTLKVLESKPLKIQDIHPKKSIASFVLAIGSINRNTSAKAKTNVIKSNEKMTKLDILNSASMKYITYHFESTSSPPPPRRFLIGKTMIVPLTNSNSSRFGK